MSKDDQITMSNPVDHVEEKYLQSTDADTAASNSSGINDDNSSADTPPNLDDIRSAGF